MENSLFENEMLNIVQKPTLHKTDVSRSTFFHGDCLVEMDKIEDKSVDMILADPPYGTTACKWDTVIPFEPMWKELKRIIKPNGAILLFGSDPFTSNLILSNIQQFKYNWYWKKSKPNGWQHASNKPMATVETISVFSKSPMGHISLLGDGRMNYYPQGVRDNGTIVIKKTKHGESMGARPNQVGKECISKTGFPSNFLEYPNVVGKACLHPTQKPVALLEYLIKTYTLEGETVLDFTMGSFSTAIACLNTKRSFIGIEKDAHYFQVGKDRVEKHLITLDYNPEIVYYQV